jgi:hypothetical protein
VSLAGKILYTDNVDPEIRQLQVPVNFRPGIYIVQMGIGEMTIFYSEAGYIPVDKFHSCQYPASYHFTIL